MDALITVEGVEKDFGNQVKALDQINLEIASGDIYGIIGMSGCLLYTSPSPRDA